jgi:hypothetical protein
LIENGPRIDQRSGDMEDQDRPTRVDGHAPGHPREAFCEWLEANWDWPHGILPLVGFDVIDWGEEDDQNPVPALLAALDDCTDVLPGAYCSMLDLPQGSMYSDAVDVVVRIAAREGTPEL